MIFRVLNIVSILCTVLGIAMIVLNAIKFQKIKEKEFLKTRFTIGCGILGIGIILPRLIGLLHIVFPSEGVALLFNLLFLIIKLAGVILLLLLFVSVIKLSDDTFTSNKEQFK